MSEETSVIDRALEAVDPSGKRSKALLARRLNVDRQLIARWKVVGYIPAYEALEIERITAGKVTAKEVIEAERARILARRGGVDGENQVD
jgi:DNA-binding transcriptional regulator YdaS (Cro superfamily)